jgi:putative aldouronate transport system permease protein
MMRRKKFSLFNLCNTLILLCVVIVTLYPFWYMISVSLSDPLHVLRREVGLWPKGLNWSMYELVFNDPRILVGYKNTIIYVILGTIIALAVTSTGAYALAKRDLVFGKWVTILIVFTMLFNGGMIPTFLVVKELQLTDTIWAMVLPGAVSVWNLIIMRTFFQGLPRELQESGRIDGLSDIGIFTRIMLPLSRPVIATIGLFYAVALWNNFTFALLYIRSESLYPLQVMLRSIVLAGQINNADTLGAGDDFVVEDSLKFATIIVSTLPILMVYPFIQKYFVKGALIGSVKG